MVKMVTAAPMITLFRMAVVASLKCSTKGETNTQSPKAPTIQLPTVICSISRARQREYAAIRKSNRYIIPESRLDSRGIAGQTAR